MRCYNYTRLTLIAGSLLLLFFPWGCQRQQDSVEQNDVPRLLQVEIVDVRPQQINSTLRLVGTLLPIRATTIASDVDGTIKSFPLSDRKLVYEENGHIQSVALTLDLGHKVRKGEVICQIDPVNYELALSVAKANLRLVEGELANLMAWKRPEEIAQFDAQVDEARAAHARGN